MKASIKDRFFPICKYGGFAWPQHRNRNVIGYSEIKKIIEGNKNMNWIYSIPWPFQCFTFDFFFVVSARCVSFFVVFGCAMCIRLFFITPLFNCYYQMNTCNTRELWNFFSTKILCAVYYVSLVWFSLDILYIVKYHVFLFGEMYTVYTGQSYERTK